MKRAEPSVRVGVDVGGTFTDVCARDAAGRLRELKVPTTPENPAIGVMNGVAALGLGARALAAMAHGTTAVTNAIVEGRIATVGLVTTRGFRDVLEIGRQNRAQLYELIAPGKPEALVPRRLRLEVAERVSVDGTVLQGLDPADVPALIARLREAGVDSVAVCLLHAYANPTHERQLREALGRAFPHVSISSDINAEFREYERS